MPRRCPHYAHVFKEGSFGVNVSVQDGKSLEELFAALRPGRVPPALGGAVVDATYAETEPALIPRLLQLEIPFAVDPQSLRFADASFRSIKSLVSLPYAPAAALGTGLSRSEIQRLVLGALRFQAKFNPSMYLVPALPFQRPVGAEAELFRLVHETAAAFNGSEIPERPLWSLAAPGTAVLRSPFALLGRLAELKIAGIYFQPTEFDAKRSSVERLASYITFVRCAAEYQLPVVAGRVGSFGLVLLALGVQSFNSGLMQREAFSLRQLHRPRKRLASGRSSGGRRRTAYLHQVLATLPERQAQWILKNRALRSGFICAQGRCRFSYEAQWTYARAHFLHSRLREVAAVRHAPTTQMKVEAVARLLESSIEQASHVNRVLEASPDQRLPTGHLERWAAVLARVSGRHSSWRHVS